MKGVCDNLFMKSHLYIEDDPYTAQLLNSFAPVRNKNSHFRSSSLHRVQQPLAMKNYSIKTDRNAPKRFEHPPNQVRKMSKRLLIGGNIGCCMDRTVFTGFKQVPLC